jgi:hypothetical protein
MFSVSHSLSRLVFSLGLIMVAIVYSTQLTLHVALLISLLQAGLFLCQGYVPEKRCSTQTQNSNVKLCISWGLGD